MDCFSTFLFLVVLCSYSTFSCSKGRIHFFKLKNCNFFNKYALYWATNKPLQLYSYQVIENGKKCPNCESFYELSLLTNRIISVKNLILF